MAVIKARIGGAWVDVGGAGSDEVFVGPTDPIATVPTAELWYDTDAPAALTNDLRWNTAWGLMGTAFTVGFNSSAAAWVDVPGMSVTWTAVAGRRYKTTFAGLVLKGTAGGDIYLRIADASNNQLTGSASTLGVNSYAQHSLEYVDPAASGTTTRKIQIYTTTSQASIALGIYPAIMSVEDVGPVAGAVPAPDPTPAWIPVTFSGVWANFGSGFQTAQYRKIGDIVYLRGVVTRPSGTANPILVLPVGYRPPAILQFAEKWYNGATDALGGVQVNSAGDVASIAGAATGVVSAMSIDCSFSVSA